MTIIFLSIIATAPIVLGTSEKSAQQVITENDSGESIVLKNGETFSLKLKENPTTGYSWQLKLSPGLSVLSENYTQDPAPEGNTGVGGVHLWEIKAVASGSQQIKGIYRQAWENITGTEDTFKLNINDAYQNTSSNNSDSGNGTVDKITNNSDGLSLTVESTYAYITNEYENTVSVINTETDTLAATVLVGSNPLEIAESPDGAKVYVANYYGSTVSVIETASNNLIATIDVGNSPNGIAVSPDGKKVYVTNLGYHNMSVIDTATNTVIDTIGRIVSVPRGITINQDGTKIYMPDKHITTFNAIDTATKEFTEIPVSGSCGVAVNPEGTKLYVTAEGDYPDYKGTVEVVDVTNNTVTAKVKDVGANPRRVAISPDGSKVYVTNEGSNNVSIIDASTNKVIGSVNVGMNPYGIAVTPDGKKVYVANSRSSNVSVIDTAQNEIVATLNVGNSPNGVALAKSNFPLSGTGNAINDDPKPEPTQSSNISGNGNTKIPCFEISYGVISLLAVFLYKTSIKK